MTLATFSSAAEFRRWLEANHDSTRELLVRCFKTHAQSPGLTYRQALDEALCFGWIDGVRRAVDADSFSVRFTPRKPKSYWSAVNTRRALELEREGRMHSAGRAAFKSRESERKGRYSFENRPSKLDPELEKQFRSHKRAWDFFQAQAPWYRRTCAFWVMDAKREETRARRLEALILSSARGEPVKPMTGAQVRKGKKQH